MDFCGSSCAVNSIGPANALLQSFVTSILAIHCNISSSHKWPEDYGESAINNGVDDFDFVVIGAGQAGSIVAARLAENVHNKVLLIEAGGDPPMEAEIPALAWSLLQTEIDWYYKTEPDHRSCLGRKGDYCSWHTGRVIGGSHSMNALIYLRGVSHDYDSWQDAGNPSWGWNDLLYYFKKIEKFRGKNPYGSHGIHGLLNVEAYRTLNMDKNLIMDAAKELGHTTVDDFTDGPNVGFGQIFGTLKKGRSMSTAKAFLTKHRPNLYIMKHAVARKIRFSSDLEAKAISVVYKGRHQIDVKARKEIIVSAGSIGTPKLLMLSGIGPKTHLEALGIPVLKDLDVGKNLHEHVRVELFLRYKKPFDQTELLDAFFDQWVRRKGAYGAAIVDYVGFIATDRNLNVPDILMVGVPVDNITTYTAPFKNHIAQSIVSQVTKFDRVLVLNVFLLRPESRGFMKLRGTDYRYDPLIYPRYLEEKADIRTLVRGIEAIMDFERTAAVIDIGGEFMRPYLPECDVQEYRSRKYWECYIRYMMNTCFHYVGTSKMGPRRDRSSVVNSELKVHGVKGLRVIDASIMPRIVGANPNAATMMIGEKGADFIKLGSNL